MTKDSHHCRQPESRLLARAGRVARRCIAAALLLAGSAAAWINVAEAADGLGTEMLIRLPATAPAPAGVGEPKAPPPPVLTSPPIAAPVAARLLQPDAPRSPTVQPVLPPPTEDVPAPLRDTPIAPPQYANVGLRPISSLTTNIIPPGGPIPRETNQIPKLEAEFGDTEFRRQPIDYVYRWESPAFWNKPLYFEQPNLERYGYNWGVAQSFISGAQFFVKIPLLPYMMTVHCPREPIYSLGYYRPGSRAPYQINWPEVRTDASIVEAAFITGLCFLIP